jgi:hypothetical protein
MCTHSNSNSQAQACAAHAIWQRPVYHHKLAKDRNRKKHAAYTSPTHQPHHNLKPCQRTEELCICRPKSCVWPFTKHPHGVSCGYELRRGWRGPSPNIVVVVVVTVLLLLRPLLPLSHVPCHMVHGQTLKSRREHAACHQRCTQQKPQRCRRTHEMRTCRLQSFGLVANTLAVFPASAVLLLLLLRPLLYHMLHGQAPGCSTLGS